MMARARWLMVISALTTALAIAAVLGLMGYRIFHAGRSAGSPGAVASSIVTLPKGARVVATVTAGDRIVVTLDIAAVTEIRTFDAATLQETAPACASQPSRKACAAAPAPLFRSEAPFV